VKITTLQAEEGRPGDKRALGISRRGWEDTIKMDPQEVGLGETTGFF
jgi:hypothetical protein